LASKNKQESFQKELFKLQVCAEVSYKVIIATIQYNPTCSRHFLLIVEKVWKTGVKMDARKHHDNDSTVISDKDLKKRVITTLFILVAFYYIKRDLWPVLLNHYEIWNKKRKTLNNLKSREAEIAADTKELEHELAKELIDIQRTKKSKEAAHGKGLHQGTPLIPIVLPTATTTNDTASDSASKAATNEEEVPIKKKSSKKKPLLRSIVSSHANWIYSVAWSPDGRHVLTGCGDNTITIWDVVNFNSVRTLQGHSNPVSSVTWSPDGRQMLTGSDDMTAKIWDAATGNLIKTLRGHTNYIHSVSWSPDCCQVLTGSYDTTAKVWNADTGEEIMTLEGSSAMFSVSWSPDGRRVITGNGDATVNIWDVASGKEVRTLQGHSNSVSSVAWSPDGRQILTGSADKIAIIWDSETGTEIISLKGHDNGISSVDWSPDGRHALTGSSDKTAKLWDSATGREIMTLIGHTSSINSVSWSPDGTQIITASGDTTIRIWNSATGKLIKTLKGQVPNARMKFQPPPQPTAVEMPVYVTDIGEFARIISRPNLTVVDFAASWCGPCKAISPFFDQLAIMYPNVKFIKVDVDEAKAIAAQQGVHSMPTFKFFVNGREQDTMKGANRQKLEELIIKYRVDVLRPSAAPALVMTAPAPLRSMSHPELQMKNSEFTAIIPQLNPWKQYDAIAAVADNKKREEQSEQQRKEQLRLDILKQQDQEFMISVSVDAQKVEDRENKLNVLKERKMNLKKLVPSEPRAEEDTVLVSFRLDDSVTTGTKRIDRLFRKSDDVSAVLNFIASHDCIPVSKLESLLITTSYPVKQIQAWKDGLKLADEEAFQGTNVLLLVRDMVDK
jgi:thioredoxin